MMPADPIRVLTLNLYNHHEGEAAFERRFSTIVETILEASPDVLCLQEAPSPEIVRTITARLSAKRAAAMRAACTEMVRADGWREWLAIIHPGTNMASKAVVAATGERFAIGVRLASSGLWVVSAHLNPHSAEARHEQAELLLDSLPQSGLVIVCGDLNAAPKGGTLAVLRRELSLLAPGPDVTQTFATGLRADLPDPPHAVFDYILGRGVESSASGLVGDEARDGTWCSDHAGVWALVQTAIG